MRLGVCNCKQDQKPRTSSMCLLEGICGGRDEDSQQIFPDSDEILMADFLEYCQKRHLCVSLLFTSPEGMAQIFADDILVLSGRYQYI